MITTILAHLMARQTLCVLLALAAVFGLSLVCYRTSSTRASRSIIEPDTDGE